MRPAFALAACALLLTPAPAEAQKDARRLVEQVVEAVGGLDALYALHDVEYTYTYRRADGSETVTLERYVFDGELSWARYERMPQWPDGVSEVIEGYDGAGTWVTHDGEPVDDPEVIQRADFRRKTNYYWFAMMFKLADPGTNHEYVGTRTVDGVDHDVVRMTFGEDVGDVQDTYLLYIDPETHLVDQFLYTVMDYDMTRPSLKKVTYREVEGLMLPVRRRAIRSNWEGEEVGDGWSVQIMEDIAFDNGFRRETFERP